MNGTNGSVSARQLGFYSAAAVLVFNVLSSILMIISWYVAPLAEWTGIEAFAASFTDFQVLSMLPGFVVAIAFVPLMASIHSITESKKKVFTLTSTLFAVAASVLLGFQYYSQLTTVRQSIAAGTIEGLQLFVVGNTNSFWWPIETLGYGFMGLATLFLATAYGDTRHAVWIRRLCITNGLMSIGGLIAYPLGVGTTAILISLVVWVIVFPVLTALIALDMRSRR